MTLSDRDILELHELCDAIIEGAASGAQRARLEQMLSESEDARRFYIQAMDLSASLGYYASEMQMEAAEGRRPLSRFLDSKRVRLGAVAAVIALAFVMWPGRKPVETTQLSAEHPEYVARLTGAKDLTWANDARGLIAGDFLRRGQRLMLASGFAELTFDSGAIILLEGPAVLDVNSAWDSTLRRGTLKANVPSQAIGFRVSNPAVEVVDLGTEFSMVADAEGFADVFVLDGKVEAMPRGNEDSETILLRANESHRFTRAGASDTQDKDRTIARFDGQVTFDRVARPVRYVCWSFDELQGRIAPAAALCGFSNATFAFNLRARTKVARLTPQTDGYHEDALGFDDDLSAQAAFPGLSDNFPRTIAFWVKVPDNAPLSGAYSMVAWQGDSEKLASRPVHIAWNRNPQEGPLGAVRTDFSGGHAMGMTPLRDGKWHFIAVIFLPGENLDVPVQVKQYVDGRLESNTVTPGAKRSVGGNTNAADNAANKDQLWLGRRLGGNGPRKEHFLGEIDELVILDRGLEPAEIVELMEGGTIAAMSRIAGSN